MASFAIGGCAELGAAMAAAPAGASAVASEGVIPTILDLYIMIYDHVTKYDTYIG